MNRITGRITVAAVSLVLLLFTGCQVRQQLELEDQGGQASFEVEMKGFLLTFLTEFFDLDAGVVDLQKGLEEKSGVSGVKVERPVPEKITGAFRFADLGQLLGSSREVSDTRILTLTDTGSARRLEIRLNRTSFGQLAEIIPLLKDPYFATFGPEGSGDLTESEYTEMIAWTFEDMEETPGEAEASFRNSFVTLRIRVPGEIVAQSGCRQLNRREVEIKIPLVTLLILGKELYYSVEYK